MWLPLSCSASPTSSPTKASPTKTSSPRHLMAPEVPTRRTFMLGVVPRIIEPFGQCYARRLPQLRRQLLRESFVRTLLVVVLTEAIEATLLFGDRRCCGLRCLGLEGAVHALVPAVVLRARRRNVAGLYAQFEPPYRQARKPAGAG